MRPDTFIAFHRALEFGPGHCPPDLFHGSVPSIVRGLKVHANNISYARHAAIEETYPRLRALLGIDAFHEIAARFLDEEQVGARALDAIGEGFHQYLTASTHRNLARAEWQWLQSFHAVDAPALTLAEIAVMQPEAVLQSRFSLHPAARWFRLEAPYELAWDQPLTGDGQALLITRPGADVILQRVDPPVTAVLSLLSSPRTPDELIGTEAMALIALIDAGAVVMEHQS